MIVAGFALVVGYLPFGLYLNVLPWAVSNPKVIDYAENYLAQNLGLDLQIKNPQLKTSLSPDIEFFVDDLSLKKDNIDIFKLDNFDTVISFKEIFQKNIIVKKLGADNIFADVNKLMTLGGKQETEQKKSDWNLDFYDSILRVTSWPNRAWLPPEAFQPSVEPVPFSEPTWKPKNYPHPFSESA